MLIKSHFKNIFSDSYEMILAKYIEKFGLKTEITFQEKDLCIKQICDLKKISEKELLEECVDIANEIYNPKKAYLRFFPDEILRKNCSTIDIVDEYIHILCKRMKDIMLKNNGIGLAAPQVGIPIRLFIMKSKNFGIVNPQILSLQNPVQSEEKCLSIPNVTKNVTRYKTINVSYLNTMGFEVKETLTGNDAICFCHEYDHLNGKLIID